MAQLTSGIFDDNGIEIRLIQVTLLQSKKKKSSMSFLHDKKTLVQKEENESSIRVLTGSGKQKSSHIKV
jgi:hypothetical protein